VGGRQRKWEGAKIKWEGAKIKWEGTCEYRPVTPACDQSRPIAGMTCAAQPPSVNGPSAIAGGIRRNESSTAVPPQGQSRTEEPHLVQPPLLSKGRQRAEAPARGRRCA
jgi:hypothetical protein